MTYKIAEQLPSSEGGFIESVKRAVVSGLRKSFNDSSTALSDSNLTITLEYPMEKKNYPAIWVQFSFTSLKDQGVGHQEQLIIDDKKSVVRQWTFKGTVTVTIMALSSMERDRIADKFINIYAFANIPTQEQSFYDNPEFDFLQELHQSDFVLMAVKSGMLEPGGQAAIPGTPFDPEAIVYEDNYSFHIEGEFQSVYTPDKGHILRRIDIKHTHNMWNLSEIGYDKWV